MMAASWPRHHLLCFLRASFRASCSSFRLRSRPMDDVARLRKCFPLCSVRNKIAIYGQLMAA